MNDVSLSGARSGLADAFLLRIRGVYGRAIQEKMEALVT